MAFVVSHGLSPTPVLGPQGITKLLRGSIGHSPVPRSSVSHALPWYQVGRRRCIVAAAGTLAIVRCRGDRYQRTSGADTRRPKCARFSTSTASAARLDSIGSRLRELGVHAFLVPTDDPHLSEYVAECFERRSFVSGFTGSAGTALLLVGEVTKGLLWTDGRYFLQATRELPSGWTLMRSGDPGIPGIEDWLVQNLTQGQVVGIDPTLHSARFAVKLQQRLEGVGISLRCLPENPIDAVWGDARPPFPRAPLRLHSDEVSGRSAADKLQDVRKAMEKESSDVLVVSALDEVAYVLNVRGGDVPWTPVVLAYLLVHRVGSAVLFVDQAKLDANVTLALRRAGVILQPYEEVNAAIEGLQESDRVWLDPDRTNFSLYQALRDGAARSFAKASPVAMMKAVKNASELAGMRAAHRRDGVAMTLALSQLEADVCAGAEISEVEVDAVVTGLRREQLGYLDNSFATIAGYGPNGAIIHYRAAKESASVLGTSALFLLDSGAQYIDGTTDVTRTVHFGEPSDFERACFTMVLKGHIALATAVFPQGTPGFVLDAFARRPLWVAGLDYRHGTGHGVGAALAVHEGPQRIANRFDNMVPLEAGMIVSNEPGCYVEGEFGIRIENLMVVVVKDTPYRFDGKTYFGLEPLTLVPLQRKLICADMLTLEEIAYVDNYHQRVRDELLPLLGGAGSKSGQWLVGATTPIQRSRDG